MGCAILRMQISRQRLIANIAFKTACRITFVVEVVKLTVKSLSFPTVSVWILPGAPYRPMAKDTKSSYVVPFDLLAQFLRCAFECLLAVVL